MSNLYAFTLSSLVYVPAMVAWNNLPYEVRHGSVFGFANIIPEEYNQRHDWFEANRYTYTKLRAHLESHEPLPLPRFESDIPTCITFGGYVILEFWGFAFVDPVAAGMRSLLRKLAWLGSAPLVFINYERMRCFRVQSGT
jgi:hypothetical protein